MELYHLNRPDVAYVNLFEHEQKRIDELSVHIDRKLADLLEKADEVAKRYHTQSDLEDLAKALEPWKVPE
jgi:hypothetical protein